MKCGITPSAQYYSWEEVENLTTQFLDLKL